MKRIWTLVLMLPFICHGQDAATERFTFARSATVNMAAPTEDWDISLLHLEAPAPGSNELRAVLREKKARIMERYPATGGAKAGNGGIPEPIVASGFEGNNFQGVPNDNDMAISNDSMVVSVTNSKVYIFNAVTHQEVLHRSLANLSAPLGVSGSKYDPRALYDPVSDRFIVTYLNGFTWGTSWIIVGFSQTNDPAGDWNMYKIYGNPLADSTWSDYPVVGFSANDLYIGINTFTNGSTNNSGFVQSGLWQVGLSEGYAGTDLQTNYYHDILPLSKKIFNITPIIGGLEPYGPNMFLLSNRATDEQNDTVFVLEVSGTVSDPSTDLSVKTVVADHPYTLPVPARQPDGHWFDTNDNRILGGFYLNGNIQFVQSCTDTATGTSGIYYGVVDSPGSASPSISALTISDPDLYYGYPNISCSGFNELDEQAIVTFNHSSQTVPSGCSAIYMTPTHEFSDRILIRAGQGAVNVMSDSIERWGDYSGSQRLYDEPGTIWMAGSFANGSNGQGTWIAELLTPDMSAGIASAATISDARLFPNPFSHHVTIDFDMPKTEAVRFELYDMQGRLVRLLLEERIKAGKNRLTFKDEFLKAGMYILKGSFGRTVIFSEKIQKNLD